MKFMVGKKILLLALLCASLPAWGQEPFFSQFYNSPLTLNPALTGISLGNIRVNTNYKSYLSSVDPFTTIGASVDMSLFDNDKNPDFGGLGISIIQDESGLNLTHQKAMLSLAYHNAIGQNGSSYIALGIQGGIDNTQLSQTSLSTQSQWTPFSGYDPNLSSNESFADERALTVDFNAGLLWYAFLNEKTILFAGASVFHLAEPEKSFFDEKAKLARKYLGHLGAKLQIGTKVMLAPTLVYFYQNETHIINPGVAAEYSFTPMIVGTIGGWVRNIDAFIVGAGLEYNQLAVGLSYDLYLDEGKTLSSNGGYELSLTYHFKKKLKKKTRLMSNPSPRL